MKRIDVFGFSMILCILFFNAYVVYQHESVHRQIAVYDGCNNSSIHYRILYSYEMCDDVGYNESAQATSLHSFNEIIGYNLQAIMNVILVVCFIIGLILLTKD
jgi:hypothetical protein